MKFTRILALFLALLMLAMPLVACNKDPEPEKPTPDTPPVETPPEDDTPVNEVLDLVVDGVTDYVIVRDYKAGQEVVDYTKTIADMIKEHTGAEIQIKECFIDRPEETMDVEAEKEILVGMTNREESRKALDGLLSDDYTMQIDGSKLVIGGGGDSGTVKALSIFLNAYIYEQGNKFQVADGKKMSLKFETKDNVVNKLNYSYSKCFMLDARIDSYLLAYPKEGDMAQACKELAEDIRKHISANTGFELEMSKDTRAWGDYEILIGNTRRTDEGLYEDLADDEYFIQLVKTEVTYEDGSVHEGATLYICFGEDAADAALNAFTKQLMPASSTPIEMNLEENFVLTNCN